MTALRNGLDVFADIRETGRAPIDYCVGEGLARSGSQQP